MSGNILLIGLAFFVIALVYSSAGFGGGSSYLALLSLFLVEFYEIRSVALVCNLVVVCSSIYLFWKSSQFNFLKALPFVVLSIPMAFLGARIQLTQEAFFILLGISLMAASLVMFFTTNAIKISYTILSQAKFFPWFAGGGVGLLSGMVGIGGGIFLSPVLHLIQWDTPKRIAAISAFFIGVNSISGIIGSISAHTFQLNFSEIWLWLMAVFLGGIIGSRISLTLFSQNTVKRVTAILIFIVGFRILYKQTILMF